MVLHAAVTSTTPTPPPPPPPFLLLREQARALFNAALPLRPITPPADEVLGDCWPCLPSSSALKPRCVLTPLPLVTGASARGSVWGVHHRELLCQPALWAGGPGLLRQFCLDSAIPFAAAVGFLLQLCAQGLSAPGQGLGSLSAGRHPVQ